MAFSGQVRQRCGSLPCANAGSRTSFALFALAWIFVVAFFVGGETQEGDDRSARRELNLCGCRAVSAASLGSSSSRPWRHAICDATVRFQIKS